MDNRSPSLVIALKLQFPFLNFKITRENRQNKIEESLAINWVMWFWMGSFLFVMSVVFEKFHNHFQGFSYLLTLLGQFSRDFSIAIIIAALVAKMIEVPNLISFVNGRTIEALSDYGFLNGLSDAELDKIKKKCSKIIFEKKGKRDGDQFLNESLIEYESDITSLLLKPYHEYYKINIHCTDVILKNAEGVEFKFMKKVTKRNFKIVNPLMGTAHVDIIPPVNLFCPDGFDCSKLIELSKIIVSVDGATEKLDITGKFTKDIVQNTIKHPNYNSRIIHCIAPNKNSAYPFNSEITVEITETRFIPHSDPIYVQRVNRPTKNFSIHYTYDNPNATLKIEGFGADANLTDGKLIKTENGNSVSFDMLSWLLPGNGIIIATIPSEKVI
jgi:hypothetical protein